jgi:hypothetical protein
VIATGAPLPGDRNDYQADRDSGIRRNLRARVEHALARMKNWKILRDHRRKARARNDTVAGIASCTTSPPAAEPQPAPGTTSLSRQASYVTAFKGL